MLHIKNLFYCILTLFFWVLGPICWLLFIGFLRSRGVSSQSIVSGFGILMLISLMILLYGERKKMMEYIIELYKDCKIICRNIIYVMKS